MQLSSKNIDKLWGFGLVRQERFFRTAGRCAAHGKSHGPLLRRIRSVVSGAPDISEAALSDAATNHSGHFAEDCEGQGSCHSFTRRDPDLNVWKGIFCVTRSLR